MNPTAAWLLMVLGAYAIGSIPFGLLLGKLKGVDIRAHGSGNIGATNALRVLGKPLGVTCFILDVCKGAVPTIGGGVALGVLGEAAPEHAEAWRWLAIAGASILGHMFPIWLRFRGGKGVATGFGALSSVWPILTIPCAIALAVWLASARLTRFVGVSSCAAAVSLPISVALLGPMRTGRTLASVTPFLITVSAIALIVLWRHRGNLRRTLAGTEPRIGDPLDKPDNESG